MNREAYERYNRLANTTASNLQIQNLKSDISNLRNRVEILEKHIKQLLT